MTQRSTVARGHEIVTRWRILAEQRLDYLIALYDTGRWQRYHTREDVLANIRDAKTALEAWRLLAPAEPTQESALSLAWLDKPLPVQPRVRFGGYAAAAAVDQALMSRFRPALAVADAAIPAPRLPRTAQLAVIDFSANRVGS